MTAGLKALKDIDPHKCSGEELEESRKEFSALVLDTAIECGDNAELLKRLESALPKGFLLPIGKGTTRRAYGTPLGVTVKIQREDVWADPIPKAELIDRGGDEYLLELGVRRRTANLSEIIWALINPILMPRHYGFLGSFGPVQRHPSVLIVETVKTLSKLLPGDGKGIFTSNMGIDDEGELQIFDPRLTSQVRPANLIPFESLAGNGETKIWLGNLGINAEGRYVFVDRSDQGNVWQLLSEWTYCPSEWGFVVCGTPAQTKDYSEMLFSRYQEAWRSAQASRKEIKWQSQNQVIAPITGTIPTATDS